MKRSMSQYAKVGKERKNMTVGELHDEGYEDYDVIISNEFDEQILYDVDIRKEDEEIVLY